MVRAMRNLFLMMMGELPKSLPSPVISGSPLQPPPAASSPVATLKSGMAPPPPPPSLDYYDLSPILVLKGFFPFGFGAESGFSPFGFGKRFQFFLFGFPTISLRFFDFGAESVFSSSDL